MKYIDNKLIKSMLNQAYNYLKNDVELINSLNVFPVPDGDTGINMAATLKNAVDMINSTDTNSVGETLKVFSRGALMGARGNSGVILSQIFGGIFKGAKDLEKMNINDFISAFKFSVDVSYKAVMKPVEGTMLTVIRESYEAIKDLASDTDVEEFFTELLEASNISLNNTPNLLPILKQSGVVDSGGRGLVSIFSGFLSAIKGEDVIIEEIDISKKNFDVDNLETDIEFAYCTEFIIRADKKDNTDLKKKILSFGDSVVFVQEDDIIKIHVHTNNPGEALEESLKHGMAIQIKIENMKLQHQSIMGVEHEPGKSLEGEIKDYGIVAVCSGEGFKELFLELGVDEIIEGGQTMNPSTEDFIEKINKIRAKTIYLMPNNKNIILSAKQASEISDKEVIVIETVNIPQGIGACMVFDETMDKEENTSVMNDALEIETIQITYSVRNTKLNGFAIRENDFIAIKNSKIIAVENTPEKTLKKVLDNIANDYEIITIYNGEGSDISRANKIFKDFENKNKDIEIQMYEGKQPVYNYILALE